MRNTASSPPVPLGGHALRAPTASSVVIGRESSSVGSICRIQNQLIPYSGCRRAAQKVAPLRLVASFRFRLSSPRHTLSIPRLFACVFSHIATCRSHHCHCARSLSPARASSRDDDHPVLRGPSGYGGPAGVLRACPHRTRAPHAPPRAHFPFTRARRGEVAPASRPTSVRTPRGRRPHALTRRPRAPLPATTGPTHVQDRPDPDGACATRPDHPRPSLSVRRREIAHALPVWRKRPPRSVWIFRKTEATARKLFAAPIRRLSREVVGRAERVCLSLFARVSASTTNRLTRSPFKYNHDPHDI